MLVGPNDPVPPLSAYPKETQELVMRILLQGAKNRLAREAKEREAEEKKKDDLEPST